MCKKMGLSQQKLADMLDVSRGKVAGYFYETQAKTEFNLKLSNEFHLDLGRFLTVEMDEINFQSFFTTVTESNTLKEPSGAYYQNVISLLIEAKSASDKTERDGLIDQAIDAYGKVISENGRLKDQLMEALKGK
jgi:predicted transcriptional regulator